MPDAIRVLMVENVADDAELVADTLRTAGLEAVYKRVETERELRDALAGCQWDIVLLDYVLPGFSGPRALKICQQLCPDLPMIVVSGSVGEDAAVEMMKEGVDDYVIKGNLTRLPAAMTRALSNARVRRQHRQAQEELRTSREWLYAVLKNVAEAVIATDCAGRIRFMNGVAEELTGYPEAKAAGRHVDEIVQLRDAAGEPMRESTLSVALRSAVPVTSDLLLIRGDGNTVPVIQSVAPIWSEASTMIGAVAAFRDITERKQAEAELQQANQELYQFLRSISHDLQEPLRMISTFAALIQRKLAHADDDVKEHLRYMVGGAQRMSTLLADLRAYAEITKANITPAEPSDAELVLQSVLVNLADAIDRSGAVIAHDPLPRLQVHESHLVQLFQNLISNAIKYRGNDPPTIHIRSHQSGGQWQFSFSDNGSGIAAKDQDRVFGLFQRFHGRDIPGSGMGLAICQRIVQRYGGRMWLESSPGVGSVFHFTLPAFEPRSELRTDPA